MDKRRIDHLQVRCFNVEAELADAPDSATRIAILADFARAWYRQGIDAARDELDRLSDLEVRVESCRADRNDFAKPA